MSGASIKETLELWAASLREVKARMRPLFTQERVAASAGLFLDGLLGEERRKTGWMRAEAAGDPGPWRQQAILGRGRWDADALRDIVREYVVERLAEPNAVLVVDETGFLKQGQASCGVARQYTGSAGKITNCQIGVFAAYVSGRGHAFIDRALYLPKAWADDPVRRAAAHVPQQIAFATKPHLARAMIERAIAAGVPFAWVVGDSIYGVSEVESTAIASSTPGAPSLPLPEPRPRSPARSIPLPGIGYRPGPEPRASDCSTGPIWNWPILKPPNTTRPCPVFGQGAF
jgi:SRSO17 transposase